ncbi:MAG: carboxymuconolactone decarboxylase family protein [Proteobacteria bacterium]|nr:carboxymuconolactone decarboxylase family protein [Pseudomonadota bacterium]
MTTSRIEPLEPPFEPELAAELARFMPPGMEPLRLFRTLAHNPRVLSRFRGGSLLDRGSITRREREIVILRTCARCGSEYEWGVHVTFFAERVGLAKEEVAATLLGAADDPAFGPNEARLIRLVDALHDTATVDDALWRELEEAYEPAQLIELLVLAGFYHMVSFVTNAAGVALEPGAARFPTAGSVSTGST